MNDTQARELYQSYLNNFVPKTHGDRCELRGRRLLFKLEEETDNKFYQYSGTAIQKSSKHDLYFRLGINVFVGEFKARYNAYTDVQHLRFRNADGSAPSWAIDEDKWKHFEEYSRHLTALNATKGLSPILPGVIHYYEKDELFVVYCLGTGKKQIIPNCPVFNSTTETKEAVFIEINDEDILFVHKVSDEK